MERIEKRENTTIRFGPVRVRYDFATVHCGVLRFVSTYGVKTISELICLRKRFLHVINKLDTSVRCTVVYDNFDYEIQAVLSILWDVLKYIYDRRNCYNGVESVYNCMLDIFIYIWASWKLSELRIGSLISNIFFNLLYIICIHIIYIKSYL